MISQEELKHALYYDNVGGVFYWRNPPYHSRFLPWKRAGAVGVDGYEKIQINGRSYRSNRLAWLYMTGHWPEVCTDHIDGNKTNNSWMNLREATIAENKRNSVATRPKHDLPMGVGYSGKTKVSYRARLKIHGRQIALGTYPTAEEASEVYQLASAMLHGSFAYHLSQCAAARKIEQ
ncbi:HNH endonuclease [Comamonas aquatica]|jgi:hypothetical protein|uniref:HNH endonuclease n=1 Tax=Comamonas aquatica TaxID=225991 RepID=UPI0024488344|nr:HNH endonuclease [Comamonas aquatica]MDH1673976.1 HNH endonuclease [Comamonas aquatica]MDH1677162.1 HNH endonuclease [Comamonas aquatica]MDH1816260.1 HNH endonuclease [Comamonas aquatica]